MSWFHLHTFRGLTLLTYHSSRKTFGKIKDFFLINTYKFKIICYPYKIFDFFLYPYVVMWELWKIIKHFMISKIMGICFKAPLNKFNTHSRTTAFCQSSLVRRPVPCDVTFQNIICAYLIEPSKLNNSFRNPENKNFVYSFKEKIFPRHFKTLVCINKIALVMRSSAVRQMFAEAKIEISKTLCSLSAVIVESLYFPVQPLLAKPKICKI